MKILAQRQGSNWENAYEVVDLDLCVNGESIGSEPDHIDALLEILNKNSRPNTYGEYTEYHDPAVFRDGDPFFCVAHAFKWASGLKLAAELADELGETEIAIMDEILESVPAENRDDWTLIGWHNHGVTVAVKGENYRLDFHREDGEHSLNTVLDNLYGGKHNAVAI